MGTLTGLAYRMNQRANRLDTFASDAATDLAQDIAHSLIRETPVDTSRALSNWLVVLGRRSNRATLEYVPGERGSTEKISENIAIARADAVLARKRPGESIFISNVVRYIVYLNAGRSGQAPAMYVETAVLAARVRLRRRIKQGYYTR